MSKQTHRASRLLVAGFFLVVPVLLAQPEPDRPKEVEKKEADKKGPGDRPGGFMGPMKQARKLVAQFDKDRDGRLNREERQAARAFLKKERATGGPGGFQPGGPGGFGPGNFLTKPLLEALDTDKDGRVSKEEVAAGIRQFFTSNDKDKKGVLDEAQLADALNRIFPRPPGFSGAPPGGPAGGPPGRPPGGPPGGFGPGRFFAAPIFQRADLNKDRKVTAEEMTRAAETIFKEADKDGNGQLDDKELGAALAAVLPGPPGRPGNREPARAGPHVRPADVKTYSGAGLYEPSVFRTLFLEFEDKDWEAELADFYRTDVEVPATLIVDGKKYPNVGVHFRGMSSYFAVPTGYKRSLNLSLDFVDSKQRLLGYKTLNLLNGHEDASLMSTVLYSHIARQYIPAPRANFVQVVINGESWGVFSNTQQFNKDFLTENYHTTRGTRWKVQGSPGGGGGLDYLGDNVDDYKRRYTIKSAEDARAWQALVHLCKTLNQTPPEKLEEALTPILDLDGLLWFLALDVVLINNDGYWIRASDYNLYRDPRGKFHVIPHDMNEAFQPAHGPGFGPGPGGFASPGGPGAQASKAPSVDLDPLVGLNDNRKPLRSKVLAVPALRQRYLQCVRTIAEQSLDWQKLGPVVAQYRSLIEKEVERDTRKLDSFAEFKHLTSDVVQEGGDPAARRGPPSISLRSFVEQRRQYLLNHPEIQKVAGLPR